MNAKTIKGFAINLLAVLTLAAGALAQSKPEPGAAKPDNTTQPQQVKTGKEYLGPTADSIRPYRTSGRDPFKKSVKPRTARGKQQQTRVLGFPSLEARRADFRQKVEHARSRDGAEPDPV